MSAGTPTVLARILQSTREELKRRKRELPGATLEQNLAGAVGVDDGGRRRLHRALTRPGIGVIAEFKRRSPSAGSLRESADVGDVVGAYARGGARAVSVLTEGPHFDGSLEDLRAARAASDLPILRKDFIIDRYQLLEARGAGADAVLLIVAALGRDQLASLHAQAGKLGLDVLMEVHDREELRAALDLGASLVGINNRDLRDFSVDIGRTSLLMAEMPAGVAVVSESGIDTAAQLQSLEQQGVQAVLVGEALMRSPDPEAALRALTGQAAEEPSSVEPDRVNP